MKLRINLFAATIAVFALTTSAQKPAPQPEHTAGENNSSRIPNASPDNKLVVHSNLIFLPTRVERKNGETICGLKPEQIMVEDNGVQQTVNIEEQPESSALSLVLVVQCGRFASSELNKFKGLGAMIEGMVGESPHEVAVVSYGEGPYLLGDFSSDSAAVRRALSRLAPCGHFHAATIDAVYYAVNMLKRRQTHSRRAIILISESRDDGSHSKLRDVVTELGVTDTMIYSMAFSPSRDEAINFLRHPYGGPAPEPSFTPWPPPSHSPQPSPSPSPQETNSPEPPIKEPVYIDHAPALGFLPPQLTLVLKALRGNTASELASLSGGEYMKFSSQKDFENNLQRISNQIHNYYLLSFKPPTTPTFGLHSLRVRIPDYPDAVIQTRKTYWSGVLESPVAVTPEQ